MVELAKRHKTGLTSTRIIDPGQLLAYVDDVVLRVPVVSQAIDWIYDKKIQKVWSEKNFLINFGKSAIVPLAHIKKGWTGFKGGTVKP